MAADSYRDSIHIQAEPAVVFDYFTKPEALITWMGERAILDPRPSGRFTLSRGSTSSILGSSSRIAPSRGATSRSSRPSAWSSPEAVPARTISHHTPVRSRSRSPQRPGARASPSSTAGYHRASSAGMNSAGATICRAWRSLQAEDDRSRILIRRSSSFPNVEVIAEAISVSDRRAAAA